MSWLASPTRSRLACCLECRVFLACQPQHRADAPHGLALLLTESSLEVLHPALALSRPLGEVFLGQASLQPIAP